MPKGDPAGYLPNVKKSRAEKKPMPKDAQAMAKKMLSKKNKPSY